MKTSHTLLAGAAVAALASLGAAALAQPKAGTGTATYWMTAETASGMAGMAAAANPGAMMGSLLGRGGNRASWVHNLMLQLGSGQRPTGEPAAEHVPPAGLQAGPVLPLVTPRGQAAPAQPAGPWTRTMERPRGRMLIYWGCGDHVRPGQPAIVDFASLAAGKVPAAFANANIRPMTPPSASTSATYGEWPNPRSQGRVPAGGSLVGDHVVRGNYTPEMRFALGAGQDFLAPIQLTGNAAAPSGAVPLVWRPVPGARAWLATVIGSGQSGDMILWSSSETPAAAMAMDYLADAELARLVQQRVLLPAAADRCTVPAEVARAAPQSMLSMTAFGGEANFAEAKPAGAPASWRPAWTVKLRTKSTYAGLLGMDMAEMIGAQDREQPGEPQQGGNSKKSKLRKGLKGLLGH